MIPRLLGFAAILVLLCGCPSMYSTDSPGRECTFVIASETDGVEIVDTRGTKQVTQAGENYVFSLPCGSQSFRLRKTCYPEQRLSLTSDGPQNATLRKQDWEQYGYFRVENDSASELVEVVNLPGDPLRVPSREHAVRRMPLGHYQVELSAPYKESVQHDIRLCEENEVYSLRLQTEGVDGDLVAEGAQSVTLQHGMGRLLVVTETPNLSFRITPDRSEEVRRYLDRLGISAVAEIDLDRAPQGLRQALALLRRFDSESFRAPIAISLPAGALLRLS